MLHLKCLQCPDKLKTEMVVRSSSSYTNWDQFSSHSSYIVIVAQCNNCFGILTKTMKV